MSTSRVIDKTEARRRRREARVQYLRDSFVLWRRNHLMVVGSGILVFLYRVEEPELLQKFGDHYRAYRQQVPMLLPSPRCLARYLFRPLPQTPNP